MERNLIQSLLRIYHSDKPLYNASGLLIRFVEDFNIGRRTGTSIAFSLEDRVSIQKLLFKKEGIDVNHTQPGQWAGLSRTQSLEHSHNEKMTSERVRQDRVAIKALPGNALMLDDQHIHLPAASNLDVNWQWVAKHCAHTSILMVENWEAFDNIHHVSFDLSRSGENPLVVFRGSPVYRQDYAMDFLNAFGRPVFAFVDFDPSGLVLAQSTPYFRGLLTPPEKDLIDALKKVKNYDRYLSQLIQAQATLNESSHSDITTLWKLLQSHGSAVPQEYFLTHSEM